VADAILPRLPVTLELGVLAIALATLTAVVVNSITTGRRVVRPVATALAVVGITLPNFALGLCLNLHVLGQARLAAFDRLGAVVGRAARPTPGTSCCRC
jgi:ABC-type dipeptide/oligopeptide/nickel transport system permease component